MKIHFFYEHLRMINRYRDKHILEMCMDMVYVCVHKDEKKFTVTRLREW